MRQYHHMLIAVLQIIAVKAQGPATLSVTNVQVGSSASFVCFFPYLSIPIAMDVHKGIQSIYACTNIKFPCTQLAADPDYSIVEFTDLGKASAKGTFTIANVSKARDEGEWKCSYGVDESTTVHFDICNEPDVTDNCMVTSNSTTATYMPKGGYTIKGDESRTCDSGGTWSGSTPTCTVSETECSQCWYYWLFLLILIPFVGLVGVIIFVSRNKTLVSSTLYVNVTKNIVKLKMKPEFEPVPNTTYATCAQNGLTENAEFIDGLLVVEFRHLIPERQHDVIIYCQNPADMKLYKSETFTVCTLRDSSNTNPKNCNPVLALHSLDLTVYQRKVELKWTSPIAFDSTQVEYCFGSDKLITISENKHSPATSTADMTRLLPGRMITFTITGEKDGTKYPSGILHQKTLTDCCP